MARGPKFSFPIPGRKSHSKIDRESDDDARSNPPIPPVPEWSPRLDNLPSFSKAERVLGTAGLPFPFRPASRSQTSLPRSPGYMTVTVSEASFGSEYTDRASSMAGEDRSFLPKRPGVSNRPSSNILGSVYHNEDRRGSNCSSISNRLHPKTSNSTMRSYYDSQKSPLSISQQTSASAVRDMALRKGQPSVAPHHHGVHVLGPSSRQTMDDAKKQNRKSKPARLDLSKLFPKPRGNGIEQSTRALLSPSKLVNSPTAMSTASDYFPRPMTRDPTPTPKGRAKLTRTVKRQQDPSSIAQQRSTSPVRLYKRDTYDNAKINVRRPPRGIQHWFDGLDEDSDEDYEGEPTPVLAPIPLKPNGQILAPVRKSSLGRLVQNTASQPQLRSISQQNRTVSKKEQRMHANPFAAHHLTSPSQFSVQSQSSLLSTKTKESAFSKNNLQDSSVLSISSSEDEDDEGQKRNKARVRDSIDSTDDHGDIIIGKAQAFEVRPRLSGRRPSDSKLSMRTTSTTAATIEVMYTPEPYTPQMFPRSYSSRRSSHIRQPSVIPENENVRPKTSATRPMSPTSIRSARTSTSEPRTRSEGHKLMAVTAEEEALLEMMRRKRAAMAKHSFTEGYKTAIMQESRQKTPPEDSGYRTSAFLATDSPSASPARATTTSSSHKPVTNTTSPLLLPPPRGRPTKSSQESTVGTSILRDSSSCEAEPGRQASPPSLAHQLSPPPEFTPLDLFTSPAPTPTDASIASPTTTDHPSPLPSPVTPGLRNGEGDVHVKVASSEPSCNGDSDEVAVLDTGVIDAPSGSIKPNKATHGTEISTQPQHQRRRTASSGAEVSLSPLRKSSYTSNTNTTDPHETTLPSVSETSSRAPGIVEPKIPRKDSKRVSSLSVNTNSVPRSRNSSIYSTRTSSPLASTSRRSSRIVSRGNSISSAKRDSVAVGLTSTRCSVSEDVLAAWGDLGGWRGYA